MGVELTTPQTDNQQPAVNVNLGSSLAKTGMGILTGGISGIAGGAISSIVNGIFGKSQEEKDAEQLKQQAALTQQQLQANEALTDYQRQSQLKYQTDQYGAQLKGMQQNGLSVGLMYGGSGGGGGTGGSAATMSEPQASDTASQTNAATNAYGMQLQAANQLADTQLKAASAAKATQDTATGVEQANNLKLDAAFKEIQNSVADETMMDKALYDLESAYENMLTAKMTALGATADAHVKQETQDTLIKNFNAQLQLTLSNVLVAQSQQKLNETQAEGIIKNISLRAQELKLQGKSIEQNAENIKEMVKGQLISSGINAGAQLINGITNAVVRAKVPGAQVTNTGDTYKTNYIMRE
jgi:hypothetical protein